MSAPPRPVARAVSLASPFSPRRGRGAAARPLSTAALLDSADEGDDEEVDNAAAASCGPAEPADDNPDRPVTPEAAAAAAPPVKRSKGRIRRKNSKSAQQGPKFSDSGGGAAAASKGTADNGELVLSANAILDSLARLREQSDAKACAVTASDNVTTSTPSATSTSSPAAEDGPRADDDDKQEAESWSFRRRKGGAEGEASSRSYHRDCQEALQSLLWEPYDCRDPKDTPMYQYADDADVSLWLYPRPGLGGAKLSTRGGGEGCRCPCRCALHHSPSDSSSDCSSMSDTSPSSPTPVPLRETSASSLRGLLTASTSGGSSAADGWTAPRVTPGHQHQHHHHHHHHSARRQRHQASPRLVTDLKTPWIGTPATQPPRAASSLRGAPPAALGSPRASLSPPAAATAAAAAAAAVASVAPPPRSRQSETGRAARRTLTPASPGSACSASYGHRRPGPNMLVNVSVPQDVSPCVVQVPSSGVSSVTVSGVVTSAVSSASSATSVCVPSPSVSAVPTIPCLNNVSNVHIHASSPTPRPRPRAAAAVTPASPRVPPPPPPASSGPRTYASTEAQTDDLEAEGRRERRRERRERRHLRRLQPRHPHPHPHGAPPQTAVLGPGLGAVPGEPVQVPDLLHSHLPPPYSTLPLGLPPHILAAPVASMPLGGPPPLVAAPHGAPPPQHPQLSPPPQPPPGHHRFAAPGLRLPFAFVPASRRRPGRGAAYSAEEEPKSCCGVLVGQPVSIRWFILLILLVGLCCAVVGTVLGAMKASGREHLTVSLLMIGVGIVLVTVSGVAWRLTSHDAPSCRVMLGMASGDEGAAEPNRRFVPRLPPSYGRPHHPYAAMMYPEFQYRPPPPSYQASMQEYRLRLLLLDRHPGAGGVGGPAPPSSAVSPPPTYRSHAGSLLRAPLGCRREVAASEYSRPPSYRSRSSSTRPSLEPGGGGSGGLAGSLAGALAGALGAAGLHSRTGSVATEHSLSDAGTCPPQPVSVISVGGGDSVKCDPDSVQEVFAITGGDPASSTLQMMLRKSDRGSPTKDTNLVTIVQTSSSGAVTAPAAHPRTAQERPAPVIVTVSGATTTSLPVCSDNTEMEILAHL